MKLYVLAKMFKKHIYCRQPIRTIHLTKSIFLDNLKHTVFAWEKLRFSWRKACRAVLIKAEILLTVPPTTIDFSERIKRREPTHEGTCIPASNRITGFKWYTMGEVQLFKDLAAERKTSGIHKTLWDFVGLKRHYTWFFGICRQVTNHMRPGDSEKRFSEAFARVSIWSWLSHPAHPFPWV